MIHDILIEVDNATNELVEKAFNTNQTSLLLLLARADVAKGLKGIVGTDCITDYMGDLYRGETAEKFYIRYMNKNYKRDGFTYEGEDGLDALSIEMMIYTHLWASYHFFKTLYRFGSIFNGQDYPWEVDMESREVGRWNWMNVNIIDPLENASLSIAPIIKNAYNLDIRDAFAHALYTIDEEKREIHLYPKRGRFVLTFEDFQRKFLYSVMLMNTLHNKMAIWHDQYARLEKCLTTPFLTPEGVKCQLYGKMQNRGGTFYPEFRLVRITEQ